MRKVPLLLLIILSVFLLLLGLAPSEVIAPYLPSWLHSDTNLHFLAFCLFTVLFYFALDFPPFASLKVTLISMFVLSVVTEILQGISPYRSFDGKDIPANLAGTLVGTAIAITADLFWRRIKRARATYELVESELSDVPLEHVETV